MIPNKTIPVYTHRIFVASTLLLLLLAAQSLLTSCDSDTSFIGESLQPPSELMNAMHMDSLTLNAYTFTHDSVKTSNFQYALVGSLFEPVFGSSRASFLSRVRLDGTDTYPTEFTPGPDAVGDSIVLTLLPHSFYGDPETILNLKIYKLTEDILRDSSYYENHNPQFDPATEHTVEVSMTDTLIRVVLDSTFINGMFDDVDTIETQSELREHFKGIYITADSTTLAGDGAIMSIDLLSFESTMIYHYRKPNDSLLYYYEFQLNISSARANMFSHDHSTGQIAHLNDTTMQDTLLYIQGIGGTYGRVDIPYLNELNNIGPRAINKAEISFKTIDYVDTTYYPPPENLLLLYKNEDGEFQELFDLNLGDDFFGGSLDDETGEYTFNVTNHVRAYLDGEISHPTLYVFVKNITVSPERVALFNSNKPNNIRFRILYTLL